jgi:hypothetical protein
MGQDYVALTAPMSARPANPCAARLQAGEAGQSTSSGAGRQSRSAGDRILMTPPTRDHDVGPHAAAAGPQSSAAQRYCILRAWEIVWWF